MTRPPPATRRKDGKAPPQRDLFQLDSPLIGAIRGGRQGTKLIGEHFAPEVSTQLRILAAEERTTVQSLLGETLDDLFVN